MTKEIQDMIEIKNTEFRLKVTDLIDIIYKWPRKWSKITSLIEEIQRIHIEILTLKRVNTINGKIEATPKDVEASAKYFIETLPCLTGHENMLVEKAYIQGALDFGDKGEA